MKLHNHVVVFDNLIWPKLITTENLFMILYS